MTDLAAETPIEAQLETWGRPLKTQAGLGTRFGRPLWRVTLAPGESATLRYTAPSPRGHLTLGEVTGRIAP